MSRGGGGTMFAESSMHVAWGAAFTLLLLTGCVTDLRSRRIPNVLVALILLGGVAFSMSATAWPGGLSRSAGGVAVGFAIWIGFHLLGVMGAGDVKFFAAAGAWLGAGATWRAAVIAALAGGVLAVVFLARHGRLSSAARRLSIAASSASLTLARQRDAGGDGERGLPYGVALAVGALVMAWLPSPIA